MGTNFAVTVLTMLHLPELQKCCLAIVLFIRNYSVERQVRELELKATVNYPAGYQNTANKDNPPGEPGPPGKWGRRARGYPGEKDSLLRNLLLGTQTGFELRTRRNQENIGEEIEKQGRFFALIGARGKVHVKRSPDRRGRIGRRGLAPGMTGGDGKNGIQGAKGESGIRIALQGNKDQREVTELLALKEIPDVMEEKVNQGHRESGEDVELEDIREKKGTPETEKGDSLPVSGSC
ncbi:uncharacterized protein [Montipora capricornis]|uniref:uncharacterized protein isoform X3 n=1 Tax=Montipora capricornis TaxID=246305 RepID=UPI0035F1966E